MSTREKLINLIDGMTDEQMNEVVIFIQSRPQQPKKDIRSEVEALKGIFHDVADPAKVPFEREAWANAAVEKHQRFLEEMKNANS